MRLFVKFIFSALLLFTFTDQLSAQYVRLNGKQFINTDGSSFFPMVMNYNAGIVYDPAYPFDKTIPSRFKVIRNRQYGTLENKLEPTNNYSSFSNCDLSLRDDFKKLNKMGFNAIRLLLSPNRENGQLGFTIGTELFSINSMVKDDSKALHLVSPYTSGDALIYFKLIKDVLEIAYNNDIKVILLCADHAGLHLDANGNVIHASNGEDWGYPEMTTSLTDANDYKLYLSELAKAIDGCPYKSALLAYDLYNEPQWGVYTRVDQAATQTRSVTSKQTICEYVSSWYDIIKQYDANHLITIGLWDIGDVFNWDPGVMKVDFISMHLYPDPITLATGLSKPNIIQRETERIVNLVKWCNNALQKPWIIGETAFNSSDEACLYNSLWGNDTDQKSYIDQVLPTVRDCGGSGFSWWQFQELHWYCVPTSVCQTCNYCSNYAGCTSESKHIQGNYWGLLKYGDQDFTSGDPFFGYYPSAVNKAAVQSTIDFNFNTAGSSTPAPATCISPPSTYTATATYFDPYNSDKTQGNYVTGYVNDQNGNAIKDAVISVGGTINGVFEYVYTFTDANGFFKVFPAGSSGTRTITLLRITAVGAQVLIVNYPVQTPSSPYVLNKRNFDFDGTDGYVSSQTITNSLQGWNSLTTSNITIPSGATVDLKARNEINLLSDFHAQQGSETHIYCTPTFPNCPDFSGYSQMPKGPSTRFNEAPNIVRSEIADSNFKPSGLNSTNQPNYSKDLNFIIQPNPNNGTFSIIVNTSGYYDMYLYDIMGKLIQSQTKVSDSQLNIDIAGHPKGVYYTKIIQGGNVDVKRIVNQ